MYASNTWLQKKKERTELAFLPEPLATAAMAKGKKMEQNIFRALDFQEQWGKVMKTKPRIPQAGLQINRDFYVQNQEIVTELFSDISDAAIWSEQNISAAAEIGSTILPVPKPILTKSLPHAYLTGTSTADIADEILFFFEQMYQLNPKIVGGKMPTKALFSV